MSSLRSSLIRLAHANPDLRPHLLPVIKAASSLDVDVAFNRNDVSFRDHGTTVPIQIRWVGGVPKVPGDPKVSQIVEHVFEDVSSLSFREDDFGGAHAFQMGHSFEIDLNVKDWSLLRGYAEDTFFKSASRRFGPMPRSSYPPKDNPTLIQRENTPPGLEIWTYEIPGRDGGTTYAAAAFWGKASKPLWHNTFTNVMRQEEKIDQTIKNFEAAVERKQEAQRARSQFAHGFSIGDILVSSWGYDQTNVDWYEVVGIPTPKTILIRPIGGHVVKSVHGADYVSAVPGSYTGPAEKKIPNAYGVKINSYATARKWDGKPMYQTPFSMGH